ncbi:hypothetical protein K438DRAFT_1755026 [Mycena galopus ATCC 62051]|nr:hypothetical protein K438DRAFT_1755026 [Mycena galopus ATCC 62051]
MDFDLRYPDGSRPRFLWSKNEGFKWCSVGTSALSLPDNARSLIGGLYPYSSPRLRRGIFAGLALELQSAPYEPARHWYGWMPVTALEERDVDPVDIAFTDSPAPLQEHYSDVLRSGGSDDGEDPVFLGYFVEPAWRNRLLYISRILNNVTMNLVVKTEFYGSSGEIARLGDLPEQLNKEAVSGLRSFEVEAREMADDGRRVVLSQLGFLSWLISAFPGWEVSADDSDSSFIDSLRLGERKKRGFVFDLSRDRHEFNIHHLIDHRIPFHYAWTEAENGDSRYFRLSPDFTTAHEIVVFGYPQSPIDMTHLPLFDDWLEPLRRFDIFLQDVNFGRVGRNLNRFNPGWVLHTCQITDAYTRHAYSERFKGMIKDGGCIFYRQEPIFMSDEPLASRQVLPDHPNPITDFGGVGLNSQGGSNCSSSSGPSSSRNRRAHSGRVETESHGRSNPSLAERLGVYDIRRAKSPMSPTHRSSSPEPGLTTRWSRQMAGTRYARQAQSESPHRGASEERRLRRSRSPISRGERINREERARRSPSLSERSLEGQGQSSRYPSLGDAGAPYGAYSSDIPHGFRSCDEAASTIRNWAGKYVEFKALAPLEGLELVNREWFNSAILVCDIRSMARMRAWAAVCPITDIAVVLMMALACGVPFELYVDEAKVDSIGVTPMFSALMRKTLEAIYSPGYSETHLTYGSGGGELYARYSSQILGLLACPHAIAFLYLGGVCSFIAQLYNEELINRFLEGPTVQVREYHKGKSFWLPDEVGRTRWTYALDVSEGEVSLLLGHVPTGDSRTETWLWPKPEWLENKSDHFQGGAWTKEAYGFLKALENKLLVRKEYVWRTKKDWLRYISGGNRRAFAAEYVPMDDDFTKCLAMIKKAFPTDWDKKIVGDIELPEEFQPS